jgi:hypothetical protein
MRNNNNIDREYLAFYDALSCGLGMMKETSKVNDLKLCECGCGQSRSSIDSNGRHRRFINGHNSKGERNARWKGERLKHGSGYIRVHKPEHHRADKHGRVYEHIIIYEEFYKCCTLPWTNIHHINHVRDDNRIENLQGLINSKHYLLYHLGKKRDPVMVAKMSETKRNSGLFRTASLKGWKNRKENGYATVNYREKTLKAWETRRRRKNEAMATLTQWHQLVYD